MTREYPGGIPEHIPTEETRKTVRDLYAAGIRQCRIAERFDIDERTLRKHYRAELDDCKDAMTAQLGKNLFQEALAGDKAAREFWLKCQGRWSYARAPEDVDKDQKQVTLMEKLIDKL